MSDFSWTEERVRQLLLRAQPYSRGGTILGAKLGALFRRLDSAFHPGVLGDQTLKSLLTRFPDLGTIEPYAKSLDFVFRFRADKELANSGVPQEKPPNAALDRDLWIALVAEHPHEVRYIDLHTIKVVAVPKVSTDAEVSSAPSPIEEEPERFLLIPPIPQDDLRTLARDFAAPVGDSVTKERLLSLIDREGWFRPFTKSAAELELGQPWLNAHRAFVIDRAIAWLKSHGIDPRRFLRTYEEPRPNPRPSFPSSQPALDVRQENVRAVVLRAVSRMSDQELLNLPIPLRYLVS